METNLKELKTEKQKLNIIKLIPNALCVVRLILAISVPFVYFYWSPLAAFIICVVACLTDSLDGIIARKCNAITKVGKWLDPVADKFLKIIVLVTLTIDGRINLIIVSILAVMEFTLMISGAVLYSIKRYLMPSNIVGKVAAVLIYIGLMACFFDTTLLAGQIMIYIGLIATFISGFIYFLKSIGKLDKSKIL